MTLLLAAMTAVPVRADAVALEPASGWSCQSLPASECIAVADARANGTVELDAQATAPAFGDVPGRATGDAWGELLGSVPHDGARSVSVNFDLVVDDAAVYDTSRWAGSDLEGDAVIVAIIRVYQPGSCCGTFHTRPIVRSARLGGTWWAPERASGTSIRLGGSATNGPDPLPAGTTLFSISLRARVELRNALGGPGLGETVATMRARVANLAVVVNPL